MRSPVNCTKMYEILNFKQKSVYGNVGRVGALGQIRTADIRLRRPTLYPAELRAQYLVDTPQFSDTKGFMLFAHINLALSASVIIC